jgi:adenine/guanine phosphoribosyltransferase-like PRPP-binding protein
MVETLSIIAAIAMAVSTGALLLLHLLPTDYNPIRDAVSDYAIGKYRALFWTFVIAGAVSGLALAIALARSHPSKPALRA